MKKKFAAIKFVSGLSEIPMKYKISAKSPPFLTDWYIHKYNPYILEDTEQFGEQGIVVRLPVTKAQAENEPHKALDILRRTIADVCDYSAGIAVLDDDFPYLTLSEYDNLPVRIATGIGLFPFFIMESIYKALAIFKKDIRKSEILIIPGEKNLTLSLLDNIYPYVNYLSILANDSRDDYSDKVLEAFKNTGLILRVTEKSPSAFTSADIIINLSTKVNYDTYFMRGAIYFDLCGDEKHLRNLLSKREDMVIIDGLRLKIDSSFVSLKYFEAVFYAKSRNYRQLLNLGYNPELITQIAEELQDIGSGLSAFYCRKLLLTKNNLNNIQSKTVNTREILRHINSGHY